MKSRILPAIVLLMTGILVVGCSGKPDLDDPQAVADYICAQTKEIQDFAMQDMADEKRDEGVIEFQTNMRKFENDLRLHHGENFNDFNSKVEEIFVGECQLDVPVVEE